jgi:hypothetical protein
MDIINGQTLKEAVLYAAAYLEENKEEVNSLNVFPVPDGDTGTNMSLTLSYAAKNVQNVEENNVKTIAKMMSSGSLMGARGNSGVILSQLFRGFYEGCKDRNTLSITQFAACLKASSDMAYKAVIKPTEGTILTIAREMAFFATSNFEKYEDIEQFLEDIIAHGTVILNKTPDMLPVLKEAGVVDAGGMGLIYIYKGFLAAMRGEKLSEIDFTQAKGTMKMTDTIHPQDIKFMYCTEVMIQGDSNKAPTLRTKLSLLGDSMLVIGDDNVIKVHIHTNEPGKVITYGLAYGELIDIKIENMKLQHENILIDESTYLKKKPEKRSKYAFVAVSSGEGIDKVFEDLGIVNIIKGGQTMNPSTQDFLDEINLMNADVIYLLPNNKNIILAANQAKDISAEHIEVIPTKTIPQGISAILAFAEDADNEENLVNLNAAIQAVKTGQITFAVRDTNIGDKTIKKGNIIGLNDKEGIVAVSNSPEKTAIDLVEKMADDDTELIYVYYGEDISQKDAQKLHKKLEKIYSSIDVVLQYGGQPLYYYIISVE